MDELTGMLPLPEMTTPEEGFGIAMEGVVQGAIGKKNKLAGKDEFNAIVLSKVRPTPFKANEISAMFGAAITMEDPKTEYYGYRVRITEADNPHAFYPVPCNMNAKPTPANKAIIGMHTLILCEEELSSNDTCRIKLKNPYIADVCSTSGDLFKASIRNISLITKPLGTSADGFSIWGAVSPITPYGLPHGPEQNPG